jgi:chaperone modulatory protein CbpM
MNVVVEQHLQLSVDELGRACRCSRETVLALVHEGVLRPMDVGATDWRFEGEALTRANRALRLLHDLELNMPGVALAMQLLDRIDHLDRQLGSAR